MKVLEMIPIYKPFLVGNYKKYVNDALESTWISSKGSYLDLFEQVFSKKLMHGVQSTTVSNGTVALDLALRVVGIGPGDEVIVPNFTYIATANAVVRSGATPIFVDCNSTDWNLCLDDVRKCISKRTKAILAVHVYGAACNVPELLQLARDNGLYLIEDCAEAIGSYFGGKHVGTESDISTFSFFGNKTITTGEGGMVCSSNQRFIDAAKHLKSQAVSKTREYWHDEVGFNFRMTNLQAAIGVSQLEIVDKILRRKSSLYQLYQEQITSDKVQFQMEAENTVHSRWMVAIKLDTGQNAKLIREKLHAKNIETRPAFPLITDMPMYKRYKRHTPTASDISNTVICLPSYPELEEEKIMNISEIIVTELGG